jgi:chemotaxis methyl-accepting protein methylase
MLEVVDEGRMPPWFANPEHGHFANDPRLKDDEKRLLHEWVTNGCPRGDEKDLPPPRQFAEGWQMDPSLVRRIVCRRANLTNRAEIAELASSRVIFCRNVFIYFSEPVIRKVVATFAECMPSPGYLFVGAAESLLKFSTQFQLQQIEGSFVYVKE